jgi:hypothetical protein
MSASPMAGHDARPKHGVFDDVTRIDTRFAAAAQGGSEMGFATVHRS